MYLSPAMLVRLLVRSLTRQYVSIRPWPPHRSIIRVWKIDDQRTGSVLAINEKLSAVFHAWLITPITRIYPTALSLSGKVGVYSYACTWIYTYRCARERLLHLTCFLKSLQYCLLASSEPQNTFQHLIYHLLTAIATGVHNPGNTGKLSGSCNTCYATRKLTARPQSNICWRFRG